MICLSGCTPAHQEFYSKSFSVTIGGKTAPTIQMANKIERNGKVVTKTANGNTRTFPKKEVKFYRDSVVRYDAMGGITIYK